MSFVLITDDHVIYFHPAECPGGGYFCTFTVDGPGEDDGYQPFVQGGDGTPAVYANESDLRVKAPYDFLLFTEHATLA
jgi:hypothetical protein